MNRAPLLALALLAACPRPGPGDCQPATCESLGATCGNPGDGCGGTLACGSCPAGHSCSDQFLCDGPCLPTTCLALGLSCGPASDGCGTELDCGTCSDPLTCGGAGKPGECGCAGFSDPELCRALGAECGSISTVDGCGQQRTAFCGRCEAPLTCDTSGAAQRCFCPLETAAEFCSRLGKDCGQVTDRDLCGQPRTETCGSCQSPLVCGGGGQHNVCGSGVCVPVTCPEVFKNCGTIDDGCGNPLFCGDCPPGKACGGGGIPNVCACTPRSCADLAGACGDVQDGCGGTVRCECPAPQSCGGGGVANQCGCQPRACGSDCGQIYDGCGLMVDCGPCPGGTQPSPLPLRIQAANLTSGNLQSYDPGEGIRIFQGLKPDVALVQEFNYGDKSDQAIRRMIIEAFGPGYYHYREPGDAIPNGVVSRYPILEAGEWTDSQVGNRDFVWAHIDLPGPRDLWAVSLHLLTTSGGSRASEASALVTRIKAQVIAGDYLVIGGDLNTGSRTEGCINTLGQVVVVSGPHPVDQSGNGNTSSARTRPLDWVLADADLKAFQVPVVIGPASFPSGLVFDSRVYSPLSDLAPVRPGDSGATNMQHMAVVKDFLVPR